MSGTTPPAVTIGATTLFYVGQSANVNLLYTQPAEGAAPTLATVAEDTAGIVSATVGPITTPTPAVPPAPAGLPYSVVTIVAVAPGTTVLRASENGIDNSPAAAITITVTARPADTLAFDPTSVVITG